MSEFIDKLVTITYIKEALSNTYNELIMSNTYFDCMELINEVEKDIILKLTSSTSLKDIVNND